VRRRRGGNRTRWRQPCTIHKIQAEAQRQGAARRRNANHVRQHADMAAGRQNPEPEPRGGRSVIRRQAKPGAQGNARSRQGKKRSIYSGAAGKFANGGKIAVELRRLT